jgi:hypothetical protein
LKERSREAASSAMVASSGAAAPTRARPPKDEVPEPTEPTHRSRSLVAFVATALVLATAVGSWLKAHTPETPPRAGSVGLVGTLVYAVPDGPALSQLWRWDLATGQVRRGPRVPRVAELVNADGADFGWVGVTSVLADERLQAGVLRFLGPNDRVTPILKGDLVSWGPRGDSVVAVRRGPVRPVCRRRVSIVWAKLVPALRERQYLEPNLCGDVLSVGRDENITYFTLQRGRRVGVVYAGVRTVHAVLDGDALVSVSAASDLLVVDGYAFVAAGKGPLRPDGGPNAITGASLFFRGLDQADPIPFGTGGQPFALDRVLGWSPDALTALVTGRLGSHEGIFELDAGPKSGIRAPRFVGAGPGLPYATYTNEGTAIVLTGQGLFVDEHGSLVPLAPPADAPAPSGPIVWIR